MNNAEILVAKKLGTFKIKVIGRATFAIGSTLRNLVKDIENEKNKKNVTIDLTDCTGMDSTFMGILAMLALKVLKENITIEIVNPRHNRELLNGLGLKKLFTYVERDIQGDEWKKTNTHTATIKESAQTVLDAHKILMKADEGNIDKFKTVVNMVEKELEK